MSRPGFCEGGGVNPKFWPRGGGTREPPLPLNTYVFNVYSHRILILHLQNMGQKISFAILVTKLAFIRGLQWFARFARNFFTSDCKSQIF